MAKSTNQRNDFVSSSPKRKKSTWKFALAGVTAMVAISSTGCQMDVGGQTLPSPYYIYDDVQYFPAGAEFKLSREAAAMKAYNDDFGDGGLE